MDMIASLTMMLVASAAQSAPADARLADLGDGYVRVETPVYSIDVPKGWLVSEETRWGQRKMRPEGGAGELGAMTAPPGRQSWEQLYRTSLYFIMREDGGTATPYTLTKTKQGYEAASFSVLDAEGFAARRFMLIRHETKGLLALSVRIPERAKEEDWARHFARMVDSAVFRER